MPYFQEQMFNPSYVNPNYYQQNQMEIMRYQQDQTLEVVQAVKAMHDLCEAVKKMDMPHQQQTFMLCLEEMAREFNW